jgi:hypothetical protein
MPVDDANTFAKKNGNTLNLKQWKRAKKSLQVQL